jgi:hypothetical protein
LLLQGVEARFEKGKDNTKQQQMKQRNGMFCVVAMESFTQLSFCFGSLVLLCRMSASTPHNPPFLPSRAFLAAFFALNVAIALVPLHPVRIAQGTTKDVQGAADRQVPLFSKKKL